MSKTNSVVTEDLTTATFGGRRSVKSVLTNKLGLSASLPEVLGAIAISVVILAAAGFGIGAGLNYSQDSKAKGVLDSVSSAQTLYQSKNQTFATTETVLTTPDATDGTKALTDLPTGLKIAGNATNFCATIKSGSMAGTQFWVTAKSSKIQTAMPADAGITCPTIP